MQKSTQCVTCRVISVLGMHRSGTSVLMGCLEEYGVHLGDVIRQSPHNKRGNQENKAIRQMHDRVLANVNATWDNPPLASPPWPVIERETLRSIINARSGLPLWGFKDPRTILVIDEWVNTLPQIEFIATFRHPVNVVQSLIKRKPAITFDQALQLWLIYNRKLLSLINERNIPVICFDRSKDDYHKDLSRITTHLGLNTVASPEFYAESFRHWKEKNPCEIQGEPAEIYDELNQIARRFQ